MNPVDNKTVWRQQTQQLIFLNDLERANPCVELLLGEISTKLSNTVFPDRILHSQIQQYGFLFLQNGLASLYLLLPVIHSFVAIDMDCCRA